MRAFCTIVSRSYLPYARALAVSLRSAGNSERLHVLVTDLLIAEAHQDDQFEVWSLDEIPPEYPARMRYYFDSFELCNALKPFFVSHLARTTGASAIIYLDSDVCVTGSFDRVWPKAEDPALSLTPHQFTPPPLDPTYPNEVEIVDMGWINGGFAAWNIGPAADRILEWMRTRLPRYGFCDRPRGMFVDQKLLPLLLAYFPSDVRVLRDPGLNIAYWNAHERDVQSVNSQWCIDDSPVVFFHLSGYRLSRPLAPCIYLTAATNQAMLTRSPWLVEVLASYRAVLEPAANAAAPAPYRYASYEGVVLDRTLRRLLLQRDHFDRMSRRFWRARLIHLLRRLKHWITGIRPHH